MGNVVIPGKWESKGGKEGGKCRKTQRETKKSGEGKDGMIRGEGKGIEMR